MSRTVLRLMNSVEPTTAPYHQFTLPVLDRQRVVLCSLFPASIAIDPRIEYVSGDGKILRFVVILLRLLRRADFDVVHVHSVHTGTLLCVCALLTRPSVLRRTLLTIHTSPSHLRWRNRLLLRICATLLRRLVCCGRASYEDCSPSMRRRLGERLIYIPNGFDSDRVQRARASMTPRLSERLTLVYAARFATSKNHRTLIEAFATAAIPDAHLILIGGGPEYELCQQLVSTLGYADKVTFTGKISREDTLHTMLTADVFVSPSRFEGLPIAVLEAMACACAVVLSDIPPHREVAGPLESATFVSCNDVPGWAEELGRLAAQDRQSLCEAGVFAQEHAESRYSLARMLFSYEAVYEELEHGD